MPNRHWEDRIKLPAKNQCETLTWGVGRPLVAASGHRPSLVHCLVGPDVRWSVPGFGWSVWSGLWALFPCVMQNAIICDFVCIFIVFSSYFQLVFLQSKNHKNLWNSLVITPTTIVDVHSSCLYAGVDGINFAVKDCQQVPPHLIFARLE